MQLIVRLDFEKGFARELGKRSDGDGLLLYFNRLWKILCAQVEGWLDLLDNACLSFGIASSMSIRRYVSVDVVYYPVVQIASNSSRWSVALVLGVPDIMSHSQQ